MEHAHHLRNAAILLLITLTYGVGGYMLQGWPFHDALYMTVITITTVGYREVHSLSAFGQYFTMTLLLIGVGVMFYILMAAIEFMVEGHLKGILQKRRVLRLSGRMSNHYILCGYGRVGREVAREFVRAGESVLIIEDNVDEAEVCSQEGHLCIVGDATRDEVLEEAGIHKAKGVIAALSSDTKNVVVTLTARTLNPSVFIVARAEEEEAHRKLKHAGANRTISPYSIGGRRMATMMLQPYVTDYLDHVGTGKRFKLRIEEVEILESSAVAGKSLADAAIPARSGATVLAIYPHSEKPVINPAAGTTLVPGDVLLVMGDSDQLEKLSGMLKAAPSAAPVASAKNGESLN